MFFAGKVDINTVELIGSGDGKKIIQIVGMSFKENPKDGLRVQLLILNTFHKANDRLADPRQNSGLRKDAPEFVHGFNQHS